MTTGISLSPGACNSLVPGPGVEDVDLVVQVSACVVVVGVPPFTHCLALFDGVDTIPAMLSAELSALFDPIVPQEKTVVALERVGWWENSRGNHIAVIEAMHIIEDREEFILPGTS